MDTQNIASTFSSKSDLILADIMKKNNIKGDVAEILLTKFTMFFSRGEISEKGLIDSIQKELNTAPRMAEQIAAEIKNKLVPTLWDKMPKEERDSLLWGKNPKIKSETLILTKTMTPTGITDIDLTDENFAKPSEYAERKPVPQPEKKPDMPKRPVPSQKPFNPAPVRQNKPIGKDTYREPIE